MTELNFYYEILIETPEEPKAAFCLNSFTDLYMYMYIFCEFIIIINQVFIIKIQYLIIRCHHCHCHHDFWKDPCSKSTCETQF